MRTAREPSGFCAIEERVDVVGPNLLACYTRFVFVKKKKARLFRFVIWAPLEARFTDHGYEVRGTIVVFADLVYFRSGTTATCEDCAACQSEKVKDVLLVGIPAL